MDLLKKKLLSPLKCGVLALVVLRQAILPDEVKWWWRFHVEPNALWSWLIKSIIGSKGGMCRTMAYFYTGTLEIHSKFDRFTCKVFNQSSKRNLELEKVHNFGMMYG